ncbi:MAG: DUF1640 domain-containing protein [Ectothiorhodospira sp.]
MTSVIDLYEQLSSAPDDRARARVIAEAFEHMEQRYPEVTDLATGAAVRESELRLQKEIEQLRGETQVRIAELRGDMGSMKVEIIKWTAGLLLAQATLILGGLRFLL